MARPGLVPQAIVLALGAGALGGPDALRLLIQFAGRGSAAVDVAICLVVISLLTVPVLGTMLLALFVRKARRAGGGAPATNIFARVTVAVAVGAAFLVTACLVLVPGGGGLGGAIRLPIDFAVVTNAIVVTMLLARFVRKARRAGGAAAAPATDFGAQVTEAVSVGASFLVTACLLVVPGGAVRVPTDFAVKNLFAVTVLAICAAFAAAATGSLPCAVPLLPLRFLRGAGGAGGPAPAGRCTPTIKFVAVAVAATSLIASFVASGGLDAHLLFPEFHGWGRSMVTLPVGVAIVTVAGGTILLVRCSRRAP